MSLFYAEEDLDEKPHGVSLIENNEGQLRVHDDEEDGPAVLGECGNSEPLNLMFIFGNARSGKSFMMNALAGVHGLFRVVNAALPCTQGVDISTYVPSHAALANAVDATSPDDAPSLAFVDVEGQGDKDSTYDTMLALPLLLTSKIVLFNHKGAPTVNDMLTKLGVLARAAEYIDLDDANASDDDEKTKQKKFGHLHVLFRDFSFEGDRESVLKQLLGKEKSKKAKLTDGGADAAKERNEIRKLLKRNFESIDVWLFCQPAEAEDLKEHKELPEDLVNPDFTQTVQALLSAIVEQAGQPTLLNGQPLTGPKHLSLLRRVCTAINSGDIVNVPSVLRAMEKDTVAKVATECAETIRKKLQGLENELPLAEAKLKTDWIEPAVDKIWKTFDGEIEDCLLTDEIKEHRQELEQIIETTIDSLLASNMDSCNAMGKNVVNEEIQKSRLKFGEWCSQNFPTERKHLDNEFEECMGELEQSIMGALNNYPALIQSEAFSEIKEKGELEMRAFFELKVSQNESSSKDKEIQLLREEALKQQQVLQAQQENLAKLLQQANEDNEKTNKELEELNTRASMTQEQLLKQLQERERELEKLKSEDGRKKSCTIL